MWQSMKIHRIDIVNLFFGNVRPLPDDILFMILDIAGLARMRNGRISFYWIYVPHSPRARRRRRPALM